MGLRPGGGFGAPYKENRECRIQVRRSRGGTSWSPPAAWAPPPRGWVSKSVTPKITTSSPGDAHAAGAEPPRAYQW